jgi:hypothetical protein
VAGPCSGHHLKPLPVAVQGTAVVLLDEAAPL